jgi:hypothetical protein
MMTYPTEKDIQAAINALPGGRGVVTLETGGYMIHAPIVIPSYVHLRGQGTDVTRLVLAEGANCDVIHCVSDPNSGTMYHQHCGVSHMAIYGSSPNYPQPNTIGSGIILSYMQHCDLHDLYISRCAEYAIRVLRSYWCAVRDIRITKCDSGVQVGCYDPTGAYTKGIPTVMMSNSNLFENVHVGNAGVGIGIKINAGRTNLLMKCDTSGCAVGVRISNDQNCQCQNNQFYGHYFESNQVDIEQQGKDTWDTRYLYPIFTPHGSTINDTTGTLHIEGASIYPRE